MYISLSIVTAHSYGLVWQMPNSLVLITIQTYNLDVTFMETVHTLQCFFF